MDKKFPLLPLLIFIKSSKYKWLSNKRRMALILLFLTPAVSFDRSVPPWPRSSGGAKGVQYDDKSLPGSPTLCAGSFIIEL
jgi:hypothetical protein